MDAEFIDFLDKKFQNLSDEIVGVRTELKTDIRNVQTELGNKISGLEYTLTEKLENLEEKQIKTQQTLENLVNTIDGFIKIMEEVRTEQKMIVADIFRIKQVLKEKLGVEI